MKIRKVDDKPMVIHTKEKAKIHAHEPKGAKIKAVSYTHLDVYKRQDKGFIKIGGRDNGNRSKQGY